MDEARLSFRFGLLSQVAHIDLDDVALSPKIITPYPVVDQVSGEDLARVA